MSTQCCYDCRVTLPLDSFHRWRGSSSGHCHVCKECNKERKRRTLERYPERDRTRRIFRQAVKAGKVVRPPACEFCGLIEKPHGHHLDYSQPFLVVWLCRDCHAAVHRGHATLLLNGLNLRHVDQESVA